MDEDPKKRLYSHISYFCICFSSLTFSVLVKQLNDTCFKVPHFHFSSVGQRQGQRINFGLGIAIFAFTQNKENRAGELVCPSQPSSFIMKVHRY